MQKKNEHNSNEHNSNAFVYAVHRRARCESAHRRSRRRIPASVHQRREW